MGGHGETVAVKLDAMLADLNEDEGKAEVNVNRL